MHYSVIRKYRDVYERLHETDSYDEAMAKLHEWMARSDEVNSDVVEVIMMNNETHEYVLKVTKHY